MTATCAHSAPHATWPASDHTTVARRDHRLHSARHSQTTRHRPSPERRRASLRSGRAQRLSAMLRQQAELPVADRQAAIALRPVWRVHRPLRAPLPLVLRAVPSPARSHIALLRRWNRSAPTHAPRVRYRATRARTRCDARRPSDAAALEDLRRARGLTGCDRSPVDHQLSRVPSVATCRRDSVACRGIRLESTTGAQHRTCVRDVRRPRWVPHTHPSQRPMRALRCHHLRARTDSAPRRSALSH